jgi:hypothetical protein
VRRITRRRSLVGAAFDGSIGLPEGRLHNLVDEQSCSTVVADLRERLERWMEETDDPLLDGPVPPPPGAEFNDLDQRSPGEPTHIADPLRSA